MTSAARAQSPRLLVDLDTRQSASYRPAGLGEGVVVRALPTDLVYATRSVAYTGSNGLQATLGK